METCGIDGELYLDKGKGCCIGPIHARPHILLLHELFLRCVALMCPWAVGGEHMGHGRAGCGCLAGRSRSQKSPHWIRQRLCESALRHKDEITQD